MKRVRCKEFLELSNYTKKLLLSHHVNTETIFAHIARRRFQLSNLIGFTARGFKFSLKLHLKKI